MLIFRGVCFLWTRPSPSSAEHSHLARFCQVVWRAPAIWPLWAVECGEPRGRAKVKRLISTFKCVFPTESDFSPSNMAKHFEDPQKRYLCVIQVLPPFHSWRILCGFLGLIVELIVVGWGQTKRSRVGSLQMVVVKRIREFLPKKNWCWFKFGNWMEFAQGASHVVVL